jgi:tetraacyldisaccharide 4'-kinase
VAERSLGATVHVLDDGFQHVRLARAVDLLVVSDSDLHDRVLPAGRLREPLANARAADAVLVSPDGEARLNPDATTATANALGVETAFTVIRSISDPVAVDAAVTFGRDAPVLAVAGIARPERFFDDLRAAGWRLAQTITFGDHHPFTRADIDRVRAEAAAAGTSTVLTTAKDAVRLEVVDTTGLGVFAVPLRVSVSPSDRFRDWLLDRIRRPR